MWLKWLLGLLRWLFPVALLAVGFLVPELRLPVFEALLPEQQTRLLYWILGSVLFAIAWIIFEVFYVSNQFTKISELRFNVAASITITLVLVAVTVYLFATGGLIWGVVVPVFASILDMYISADRSINNAAQKPIAVTHREAP